MAVAEVAEVAVWPMAWPAQPPSADACVLRGNPRAKVGMLGLPVLQGALQGEFDLMMGHFTADIAFGRVGGKLTVITVRDYIKSSREVLGLLHHLTPDATLSLRGIADGQLLHAFVSMKMQRDVSSTAQAKTYGHLVKVISYIRIRDANQLTCTQTEALGRVIHHLDTCKSQIRAMSVPKQTPTVDDLRAAGKAVCCANPVSAPSNPTYEVEANQLPLVPSSVIILGGLGG